VISILDSYAYRLLVWDIYVERVSAPKRNRVSDEVRIQSALPRAKVCLSALEQIIDEGPFLTGASLTLADLHAAPMFAYFEQASEGRALLESHDSLRTWWEMMAMRASVMATVPV